MAAQAMTYIPCILLCIFAWVCHAGKTSPYIRSTDASVDMPAHAFPPPRGYNAPEQVHITQGDRGGCGVIISWVTPLQPYPNIVRYWKANDPGKTVHETYSRITSYRYYNYTSGYIHHATIKKLEVCFPIAFSFLFQDRIITILFWLRLSHLQQIKKKYHVIAC